MKHWGHVHETDISMHFLIFMKQQAEIRFRYSDMCLEPHVPCWILAPALDVLIGIDYLPRPLTEAEASTVWSDICNFTNYSVCNDSAWT